MKTHYSLNDLSYLFDDLTRMTLTTTWEDFSTTWLGQNADYLEQCLENDQLPDRDALTTLMYRLAAQVSIIGVSAPLTPIQTDMVRLLDFHGYRINMLLLMP